MSTFLLLPDAAIAAEIAAAVDAARGLPVQPHYITQHYASVQERPDGGLPGGQTGEWAYWLDEYVVSVWDQAGINLGSRRPDRLELSEAFDRVRGGAPAENLFVDGGPHNGKRVRVGRKGAQWVTEDI